MSLSELTMRCRLLSAWCSRVVTVLGVTDCRLVRVTRVMTRLLTLLRTLCTSWRCLPVTTVLDLVVWCPVHLVLSLEACLINVSPSPLLVDLVMLSLLSRWASKVVNTRTIRQRTF